MRNFIFITILSTLISSCATGKLLVNIKGDHDELKGTEIPAFTIYALGDVGEINDQSKAVLKKLNSLAVDDQQPGLVIFLGDNIYPSGLPSAEDQDANNNAKAILLNQVKGLKNYPGHVIFIPGNHDWNEFSAGGLDAIKREGEFVDHIDGSHIRLFPENGCGGPEVIELNDHLVMLIIDSQWWIQNWSNEPGMNEDCPLKSRDEFIKAFHEQVTKYKDRQIIVAMHHPLYTQGSHGGHFRLKDHLFPLTALANWLYLPLPLIGSIYPFYRSIFGHSQDLVNKRYKSLRDGLLDGLKDGNIIFLAGHEHCLQYMNKDAGLFLVSGAGSKQTAIANDKDLVFGHKSGGFMELDFFKNQSAWLTVYEVNTKTQTSSTVFSHQLIKKSVN